MMNGTDDNEFDEISVVNQLTLLKTLEREEMGLFDFPHNRLHVIDDKGQERFYESSRVRWRSTGVAPGSKLGV